MFEVSVTSGGLRQGLRFMAGEVYGWGGLHLVPRFIIGWVYV